MGVSPDLPLFDAVDRGFPFRALSTFPVLLAQTLGITPSVHSAPCLVVRGRSPPWNQPKWSGDFSVAVRGKSQRQCGSIR